MDLEDLCPGRGEARGDKGCITLTPGAQNEQIHRAGSTKAVGLEGG